MPEVSAILLAAGLSRRMGAPNKLLLPVGDKPMVRRVAEAYLGAIDGPLTVVPGCDAQKVRTALHDLPLRFAHNPDFESGQPSSVATGLQHAPETDLLLIGLADQAMLTSDNLVDLVAAHRAGNADKITIPMRHGTRGNPIVIPRSLRSRLTENPKRPGCMRFTRDYPEHVQAADLSAAGFYSDVDTPRDYETIVSHEGARLT